MFAYFEDRIIVPVHNVLFTADVVDALSLKFDSVFFQLSVDLVKLLFVVKLYPNRRYSRRRK